MTCANPVPRRYPLPPGARQRHPVDGDVPRARGAGARGDAGRAARHATRRRGIRSRSTGCRRCRPRSTRIERSAPQNRGRAHYRTGRVAARRLPDLRDRPRDGTRAAGSDLHARPRAGVAAAAHARPRCGRRSSTRRTGSPRTWPRRCPACSPARPRRRRPSCAGWRGAKRTCGAPPTAMSRSPTAWSASWSAASASRSTDRGRAGRRESRSADPAPMPDPRTRRSADPPTFTIGYAGHLYPWKGVDLVDRGGGGAAGYAGADHRRAREGTGPGAGEGVRGRS